MNRKQIETAIVEGIPFTIRMADGEKYEVVDRYRIALGQTFVVLVDDDDTPHVLPMLTMTGLTYRKSSAE